MKEGVKMRFYYKRLAKKISMSNTRPDYTGRRVTRSLKEVKFIVIHYTGGTKDACVNECDYFATGNDRHAGANFFVDRMGHIGRSIPMKYIAYHCGGGIQGTEEGSAKYHNICTNYNSVGIELCAIADKLASTPQIEATNRLVKYIRRKCPNATVIIRHWDVTGKDCPHLYKGVNNEDWNYLKAQISA